MLSVAAVASESVMEGAEAGMPLRLADVVTVGAVSAGVVFAAVFEISAAAESFADKTGALEG